MWSANHHFPVCCFGPKQGVAAKPTHFVPRLYFHVARGSPVEKNPWEFSQDLRLGSDEIESHYINIPRDRGSTSENGNGT